MPLTARPLPPDDPGCGWLDPLPPPVPPLRVESLESCDFAVIGAGFTGLAAARRLADIARGARILVLDAQRAGYGASGRSSGFVVDLAGFVAAMPEEHSRRFIRLSRSGIEELRQRVAEHRIDCDWDDRGFLHVAAGEPGLRSLAGLGEWLERRGEDFEQLEAASMQQVTGTSFYRAGIRLSGSILVQAGALVRGLAAALPAAVELFEESPVRSIDGKGPYRISAGHGTVLADRVIVALNGYSSSLGLLGRVLPLLTFGSLTRPLTADEQDRLGGESEWGVLAQDPVGSSLRRTRDQRLLIRNYVHFDRGFRAGRKWREKARGLHRQAFLRRFPDLEQVGFEYFWSGLMGVTADRHSFFGQLRPGLVASGGFSGAGIAMGTISGRLLADLVTGEPSELLDARLALPVPRWLPPRPFVNVGFPAYVARMNASAGDTL